MPAEVRMSDHILSGVMTDLRLSLGFGAPLGSLATAPMDPRGRVAARVRMTMDSTSISGGSCIRGEGGKEKTPDNEGGK